MSDWLERIRDSAPDGAIKQWAATYDEADELVALQINGIEVPRDELGGIELFYNVPEAA